MTWGSKKGKSRLIRELMDRGFSARRAERAVNAVFRLLGDAVARGETVEVPGGWIEARNASARSRRELRRFTHRSTGKQFYRLVIYGSRRRIRFRPNPALASMIEADKPKAPPIAPELRLVAGTAAALLGSTLGSRDLELLLEAASGSVSALLHRLEQLSQRGRKYTSFVWLEYDVRSLYWVRS